MPRSRLSLVPFAAALLLLLAASPSAAQPTVSYGDVELGEVRTACFTVCFGNECLGSGTIQSIGVAPPFFVRGVRTGPDVPGQSLCGRPGDTDPATLPVALGPDEVMAFDVDLVPVDNGPAFSDLAINGNDSFELQAQIFPVTVCTPATNALCLQDDRFKTRVHWRTDFATRGSGLVVGGVTPDDSGLFYFFNPDNWEMLIKVLDACNPPFDRFWVFAAATTNVEYTITVVDTETQEANSYYKPQGPPAPAITDTQAFATCP